MQGVGISEEEEEGGADSGVSGVKKNVGLLNEKTS